MSELVVIAYPDRFQAQEVLLKLRRMEVEHLIDLEDAVVAEKMPDGQVKLHQSANLPGAGAAFGGTWGLLFGFIFGGPIGSLITGAIGAGVGALSGAASDYGINDEFMRDLAKNMQGGNSALFLLIQKVTPDKVLQQLEGTGGTVIKTSLSNDFESKLRESIAGRTLRTDAANQQFTITPEQPMPAGGYSTIPPTGEPPRNPAAGENVPGGNQAPTNYQI
jgi:uncharacterized membrane protein